MLVLILKVLVVLAVTWLTASLCNYVKSDEVGVLRFFGKIGGKIYQSGPVFVPYFPGVELVRIPRKQLRLSYKAKRQKEGEDDEDEIRSQDDIMLYPEIAVFIRFPYEELASLVKMLENDVPLTEEALKNKYEDVVMPAVQEAFKDVLVTDIVSQKKAVEERIAEILRQKDGVFDNAGIMGRVLENKEPGHGWVRVQIESTGLPKHISEAMEAPVIGKLEADASRMTSLQNAQEIGLQVMITAAIISGVNVQDESALSAFTDKIYADPTLQTKPASKGGYKEVFARAWDQVKRDRAGVEEIRIGNADGSPMKGDLPAFAAAALLMGRRSGGGKPGKRGGKKGSQGTDNDAWFDKEFEQELGGGSSKG